MTSALVFIHAGRPAQLAAGVSMYMSMSMYAYAYAYVYVYICVYVHVYVYDMLICAHAFCVRFPRDPLAKAEVFV